MKQILKYTLLIVILFSMIGCNQSGFSVDGEKIREYANALYNRDLYAQAVSEYQRYLDLYPVDKEKQANITFIIGNIYFERLHDYENAMAYYLKVKHVYPESAMQDQVGKRIVACLERLQRSADARQALGEAAAFDPVQARESRPGDVIARIGDREITSGDLDFQIKKLPDYMQSRFNDKQSKIEFLRQFIATELFYDAARRKGLDQDKDVIEGAFQAKKGLMVQQYLDAEISQQVKIRPEDVKLYYDARKENYAEKDDDGNITRQKPFEEVHQQAAEDLAHERQQKAYQELMDRMVLAEDVRIFDDLIK